eukprot:TRINITY_DN5675_c0_g1_i3.p1 TRINITY_DN5675_c0_g1~~TRINITY_DN5675_c0_g1_i3.p1  ORF type:complete len:229 (+),score=48.92 TRINITY_DN5675_c0_g1_i3:49-687(+)
MCIRDRLYTVVSQQASVDLLNGKGKFTSMTSWTQNTTQHSYTIEQSGNSSYIQLTKRSDATTSFDDTLYTTFAGSGTPKHLRFSFGTAKLDIESTNLRLKSSKSNLTMVSFRCGYAGFIRVNDNQMIDFYNFTISNASAGVIWTKADITFNWDDKTVNIYLNDTSKGTANFYHKGVTEVDTLAIYNLNPGTTSFFKEIEVCDDYCSGAYHYY